MGRPHDNEIHEVSAGDPMPSGTLGKPSKPDYDYIIAGAGAAGLSLLVRMIQCGAFKDKRILLLDKDAKNRNDRTWCFWEKGEGLFEEVVYKSWQLLRFHGMGFAGEFDIRPYRYKMIRGIDFYKYCLGIIASQSNISVQYGVVSEMHSDELSTFLFLDGKKITAKYIFNSIIFSKPVLGESEYYLLQHFRGWIVENTLPVFNEKEATLMDFRVSQEKGTTFVYVMPFSSNSALVEYTLFSEKLLSPLEYDTALADYIGNYLKCGNYTITSEESGIIPMTNYNFPAKQGNIIHIGTVGGHTKASSGYTFQFIQKNTKELVQTLLSGGELQNRSGTSKKFHFYDSVLLNVLSTGKLPGDQIFTHLFSKNPVQRIFQFLDNESSLYQDIRIIASLPKLPFLKAALQQIF